MSSWPVNPDAGAIGIELKLTSDPAGLSAVRQRLESFAGECGFDRAGCEQIGLCAN
jgi:hypothetical protein